MNTSPGTTDPRTARGPAPGVRLAVAGLSAVALTSATLVGLTTSAHSSGAATTVQVSVSTGGFAPGNGANNDGSGTERRLVSADGRYVVFAASGPVVPGQKSLEWQIVRRDRYLGTTTLVSRSSTGEAGNARSGSPSISADGQVVAFHSYASNLVTGDTNNNSDVFVHDLRTGATVRASVDSAGQQVSTTSGDNPSGPPSLSADGRYVGFTSRAQGLTADDTPNANAYLHDRVAGTTEVVSRTQAGAVSDVNTSSAVSVSADGAVVAFESGNSQVVPGDTNLAPDVFIRDRAAGTTTKVPGGPQGVSRHTLSADGRSVAFVSASALVPGDTNGRDDVFVHDLVSQTTTRVSVPSGGGQADHHSTRPGLSSDGRHVTFESQATNLVGGDTNGQTDVFRHDRSTGQTVRVSLNAQGGQDAEAKYPSISGDGQHVTFESHSRTLTTVATSGYGQVYVRDLGGVWPALHARIGALPTRVRPDTDHTVSVLDVRTGPDLVVTWTPATGTKGAVVQQNVPVHAGAFTLRSPRNGGVYQVSVHYSGHLLGGQAVTVLRPTAKKLPAKLKVRKKLKVRTEGLGAGQKIQVRFAPVKGTKGKATQRRVTVNKKGVATVKPPRTRGTYRVTVRANGTLLRKGVVRIR